MRQDGQLHVINIPIIPYTLLRNYLATRLCECRTRWERELNFEGGREKKLPPFCGVGIRSWFSYISSIRSWSYLNCKKTWSFRVLSHTAFRWLDVKWGLASTPRVKGAWSINSMSMTDRKLEIDQNIEFRKWCGESFTSMNFSCFSEETLHWKENPVISYISGPRPLWN